MTTASWERASGDTRTCRARLRGPEDLTALDTIWAEVWRERDPATIYTLAVTVLDAEDRIVDISLGGIGGWLATAEVGTWLMRVKGLWVTGERTSWPEGLRPATIVVTGPASAG